MDTAIIVALITGAATVIASTIAILPKWLREKPVSPVPGSSSPGSQGKGTSGTRLVYYQGVQYRFLNFGGKNCRIEPMGDGQSFLAPTHELFHDLEQTQRITRDSIVVRA